MISTVSNVVNDECYDRNYVSSNLEKTKVNLSFNIDPYLDIT